MSKLLLDAGTSWSKVLELKGSSLTEDLSPYKVNEDEFGSFYILPSKVLKTIDVRFDSATGHMVKDLMKDDASFTNEILALAYGAKKLVSNIDNATVLDIGSRDAKWIKFKDGKYSDLDWNSACASSTGATVEMLCKFYDVDVKNLKPSSEKYSVTCGVFGMEKIMDDVASGATSDESIAKYIHGLAFNMWNFAKRPDQLYLSGGFCENDCFIASLEKYCKVIPLGRKVLLMGLI